MIARDHWVQINPLVPNVHVDEFVIMPNHLHGILAITSLGNDHSDREGTLPAESTVETLHATSLRVNSDALSISRRMSHISPKSGSLGAIIRSFKSSVTRWARQNDYSDFAWQRGYYDRIIRSDKELRDIREYIRNNPLQWSLDQYHKSE
jgi:REP element-mobilizing transposase RayT